MNEKPRQIISISEADLDFSQLAALAEINGSVVIYIYKNNKPKFKLIDLEQDNELELTEDEKIDLIVAHVLKKYRKAFEELAK